MQRMEIIMTKIHLRTLFVFITMKKYIKKELSREFVLISIQRRLSHLS